MKEDDEQAKNKAKAIRTATAGHNCRPFELPTKTMQEEQKPEHQVFPQNHQANKHLQEKNPLPCSQSREEKGVESRDNNIIGYQSLSF